MLQVAIAKFNVGNRLERTGGNIQVLHPIEQTAYVIELLDYLQRSKFVILIVGYACCIRSEGSEFVAKNILDRWNGDLLRLAIHFDKWANNINYPSSG